MAGRSFQCETAMMRDMPIEGEVVYYLQLENSRKSIVQVSDLAGYDVDGAL